MNEISHVATFVMGGITFLMVAAIAIFFWKEFGDKK
jgi:low affinity Fe/Cu permease